MGEVDLGYDWLSKAVEVRCRHIAYIDVIQRLRRCATTRALLS
jgi:hypothetical protein